MNFIRKAALLLTGAALVLASCRKDETPANNQGAVSNVKFATEVTNEDSRNWGVPADWLGANGRLSMLGKAYLPVNSPGLFYDEAKNIIVPTGIKVTSESYVYVTFVGEDATFNNVLGYFHYLEGTNLDEETFLQQLFESRPNVGCYFKNIIYTQTHDLKHGYTFRLGDENDDPFPAGTIVGFCLFPHAGSGTGADPVNDWTKTSSVQMQGDKPIYITTDWGFNDNGKFSHTVGQTPCGDFVFAFEDLNSSYSKSSDDDFNDLVLVVGDNLENRNITKLEAYGKDAKPFEVPVKDEDECGDGSIFISFDEENLNINLGIDDRSTVVIRGGTAPYEIEFIEAQIKGLDVKTKIDHPVAEVAIEGAVVTIIAKKDGVMKVKVKDAAGKYVILTIIVENGGKDITVDCGCAEWITEPPIDANNDGIITDDEARNVETIDIEYGGGNGGGSDGPFSLFPNLIDATIKCVGITDLYLCENRKLEKLTVTNAGSLERIHLWAGLNINTLALNVPEGVEIVMCDAAIIRREARNHWVNVMSINKAETGFDYVTVWSDGREDVVKITTYLDNELTHSPDQSTSVEDFNMVYNPANLTNRVKTGSEFARGSDVYVQKWKIVMTTSSNKADFLFLATYDVARFDDGKLQTNFLTVEPFFKDKGMELTDRPNGGKLLTASVMATYGDKSQNMEAIAFLSKRNPDPDTCRVVVIESFETGKLKEAVEAKGCTNFGKLVIKGNTPFDLDQYGMGHDSKDFQYLSSLRCIIDLSAYIFADNIIPDYAFHEAGFTSILLNQNITHVGIGAFIGCGFLTSLDLPNVEAVGIQAFTNCTSLVSINMPNVTTIEQDAFMGCHSLTSINLPNISVIQEHTFSGCSSLKSADLRNVTSIGFEAFIGCSSLASIDLPKATTIGIWAFGACSSLTSINLPKVGSIGQDAFNSCSGLETIILRGGPPYWGNYGIDFEYEYHSFGIPASTTIKVPNNLVETYKLHVDWQQYADQIIGY